MTRPCRTAPLLLLTLAVATAGVPLSGCGRQRPWNVLVVTLDTTRADYLGCYGRASARTPNLDRLAADGCLFRHAVAAAPITLPSHSTLFTGTYPPLHGVRDNGLFMLPEESTTLAEILSRQGYATAAAVGAFPVAREFGLAQGFGFYDDHVKVDAGDATDQPVGPRGRVFFDERSAAEVNDAILPWLRQHLDRPFFVWIHYWDAHHPLNPPAPFSQLYQHDLYQGEIASVDQSLGAVLRVLSAGGVDERTLIVVAGDHGEGRGEHYEDTHSQLAYDSTLHVPLIIRVPGAPGGHEVAQRVGLVDVLPTLLELLAIEDRPAEMQGRSLADLLHRPATATEPTAASFHYAETLAPRLGNGWGELRVVYQGHFKYIHGPRPELFDLTSDPGETRNLVATLPDDARRLRQQLADFLAQLPESGTVHAIKAPDAEARARLEALGYLTAAGDSPAGITEELRDGGIAPQDRVGDNSLSSLAKQLIVGGQFLAARDAAATLVERDPGSPFYRGLLTMALLGLGHTEQAADILDAPAAQVGQNDAMTLHVARELFAAGQQQRGRATVERLLGQRDSAAGRYLLAEMWAELGDTVAYERELRAALALEPGHAPTRLSLAILLATRGERPAAEELLVGLLRDHPLSSRYHFNYAVLLLEPPDPARQAEALTHLERAVELNPAYWKAQLSLLTLRLDRGERAAADEVFRRLEEHCREPELLRQARDLMAPASEGNHW